MMIIMMSLRNCLGFLSGPTIVTIVRKLMIIEKITYVQMLVPVVVFPIALLSPGFVVMSVPEYLKAKCVLIDINNLV